MTHHPHEHEFGQLYDLVTHANTVLLATHEHPDADAIGAVYALDHILRFLNKHDALFLPDGVPAELAFLQTDAPQHATTHTISTDALVAVDYGDFFRTRLHDYVALHTMRIATIDHHPASDHRGEVIIVDTSASSTCELVYQFCRAMRIPITKDMATCLLAGIVFDTGAFQHSSTTSHTLEAAADLVRHGARMHKVSQVIHANLQQEALRITADALSHLSYDKDLAMSYAAVSHEELLKAGSEVDLSLISYLLSTGAEQKFSVFFKEQEPKKFRVSLRSESFKGVDVSAIAKRFGGGGHKYASGCIIEGEFPDVLARVREAAKSVVG